MRCDDELKRHISGNLARFQPRRADPEGKRIAAVALTIADEAFGAGLPGFPSFDSWQDRAALVLTQRSSKLKDHPGQWALPGGSCDAGESAPVTALRELHEEVNLLLTEDDVIGTLDDFVTRSGFVMTPVIVWGGRRRNLDPHDVEVASIHRIPIDEFMREDAPMLESIPESDRPVLRMPIGTSWMAAPTAAILYQFREVCIRGLDTRVAHYEQPTFAWR